MGEIKSAWELALERTADIKGDKSSIRLNELKKSGQKIASDFLESESPEQETLKKTFKAFSKEERPTVEKAALEIFLSHITLPREDTYREKIELVMQGLQSIINEKRVIQELGTQIVQFFGQYLEHREQLSEQLKQHYMPQLRQKQEALKKQYGYEVELKPEQDPEFSNLLRKNFQKLEAQYQDALNQMKDQIRNYFGS